MKKLIVHAPNIHQGGGKTLLLSLLRSAENEIQVTALLDQRLVLPDKISNGVDMVFVKSTLLGRLLAEYKLYRIVKKTDTVLCFGNLPPLFSLKVKVVLFIQNRYLINNMNLDSFSIKERARIILERLWLKIFIGRAHEIIVQTPTMERLVQLRLCKEANVVPFFDYDAWNNAWEVREHAYQETYDFVYVATGDPQKNHIHLVEAWKLLAKDNIYLSLCLTLSEDKYPKLVKYIKDANVQYGLRIYNVGVIQQQELASLYSCSGALIYPSTLESFGLPLIEAREAGLPILAAELDYVRDLIDPEETFNPDSPISISRAVKRQMNISEERSLILSGEKFMKTLMMSI